MQLSFLRLLAIMLSTIISTAHAADTDATVAKMGKTELKISDLRKIVEDQSPEIRQQIQNNPQALEQLLRVEIMRRALLAGARQNNWDKKPEINQQIEAAKEQVIVTTYLNNLARPAADYPSEDEIKAAYAANQSLLKSPAEYHLAQIFIAHGTDENAAKSRANEVFNKAKAKGANFASLVKQYSEHNPSVDKAGDMGWLPEDQLTPEVRAVVGGMKPNEISALIRSQQGWHIIRLLETREPRQKTLAETRDGLVQSLRWRKAKENETRYLEDMNKRMPISVNQAEFELLAGKR